MGVKTKQISLLCEIGSRNHDMGLNTRRHVFGHHEQHKPTKNRMYLGAPDSKQLETVLL